MIIILRLQILFLSEITYECSIDLLATEYGLMTSCIICLIYRPNSKRFDEFYLFFVTEYFITMYSPPPPQKSRPYQLAPIQSRFPRPGPKPIFARNEMDYSSSDPSSGLVFNHTISIWFIMCFTKSCKVIILCHILPFLKQVVFYTVWLIVKNSWSQKSNLKIK